MKKIIAFLVCAVLLTGVICTGVFAEGEETLQANVYVTIANGSLELVQAKIVVTDIDGDNSLTINDVLWCTHEAKFEGGATAGYTSEESKWGLSLKKLWGIENGGSYGYYVNNASAMGLKDEIKDGDYVYAFVYTDTSTWSDTYCYFDSNSISTDANVVHLTLKSIGYDTETYASISIPVQGATITVNGVATDIKTDAEGKATISVSEGENIISATSETQNLVPPVCIVKFESNVVTDETTTTPDASETETEIQTEVQTEILTEKDTVNSETNTESTTESIKDNSDKKGCGSVIGTTGIAFVSAISVAGIALVNRKKNEK